MARKRPKVDLSQPIKPQSGELEKLFTTAEDVEQASGLQLLAVRLDSIQPDPEQPRRTFPKEGLIELSESIKQDGVIQPIEITEIRPNLYLIVHGERRWRAAKMAGLETIPAVVRRRNYDEVTRFVRQLVENIQREDLNDVDRAAGLLRLRDLMQEELDQAKAEDIPADQPWGKKMTWSKVGSRLGYSRQRIHQLIQLLNLPDEIKEDVRDGRISERDTRIYQGLKPSQQRALHKARLAGDVSLAEVKDIARLLKANPDQTVYQTIRQLQAPLPETAVADPSLDFDEQALAAHPNRAEPTPVEADKGVTAVAPSTALPDLAPGAEKVTSITRLGYIRQHLSRMQQTGLTSKERQEMLRQLYLIEQDVRGLIAALEIER